MSNSANVILFYGVTLECEAVPSYREESGAIEEGPAWLAYMGGSEGLVTAFYTGHHDNPRLAVAIAKSVKRGRDWSAMRLTSQLPPSPPQWQQEIEAFLSKYKLCKLIDVGPQGWMIAPYYG